MNEAMVLNFSKICRLCLSDHQTLLPLFNTAEKVKEKIHTISPTIEVSVDVKQQSVKVRHKVYCGFYCAIRIIVFM
jgi:hypothetical protein